MFVIFSLIYNYIPYYTVSYYNYNSVWPYSHNMISDDRDREVLYCELDQGYSYYKCVCVIYVDRGMSW